MPRSFDMATEYGGGVDGSTAHSARSGTGWLDLTESGADAYSLDRLILGEDGGIDIVTTQTRASPAGCPVSCSSSTGAT